MKRYFLYLLGLMGLVSSCKKSSLFEEPVDALSSDNVFATASGIASAAAGMYDGLQNANFLGGRALIYADQRGVDASPNTYFGNVGYFANLNASDATVAGAWMGAYQTIYGVNNFLYNFRPKQKLVSAALASQYIGEAKFIRALTYFYVVNLWAQPYNKSWGTDTTTLAVPLVLNAVQEGSGVFTDAQWLPRATIKEIYAQIEKDLLDAKDSLPAPSTDPFMRVARANKASANALLMRLYLYEGDWAKASAYADSVMAYSELKLNTSPEQTFQSPYTTDESIFSVAMSGGDNPNTNYSLGQHYGSAQRGDINISVDYVTLMDTSNDLRYKKLVLKDSKGIFWTRKYPGIVSDFVPVIRYAEVLLTKAEALARLGNMSGLGYLNQVRVRSNPSLPVVANTQQELIDTVLKERRIELGFEGHGIFEFQRTGRDIPSHYGQAMVPWASPRSVLPIPDYDRQKNPNLAQNPGY